MKWFWYSLIGFCLFMYSCKSKKVATDSHIKTIVNSELSAYHNKVEIDTTRLVRIDDIKQIITIKETIVEKVYDEKGNLSKETETKRETVQDTDKVVSEEESKGVNIHSQDSLNHIADVSKKIETETKEETKGGQEAFGKWLGIVIGCFIAILVIYLLKKLRVS